jgi:hypothetical protein
LAVIEGFGGEVVFLEEDYSVIKYVDIPEKKTKLTVFIKKFFLLL